jgi:L-alanine-DL-glutamate epimerase-like enolase superfamily enzyme
MDTMRITDIKVSEPYLYPMARELADQINRHTGRGQRQAYLEVFTDEGIIGASPCGADAVTKALVEDVLKRKIVGEDPFNVERIWEKMWWATFNFGRRGAPIIALSSVDIAIWDIIGKALNKPISKLLGGYRDNVPAYGSGINLNYTIDELVEQNRIFIRDGFKAVKMKVGHQNLDEDLERIRIVRDVIGYDIKLMVDANNGWSVQTAIKMAKRMEKYEIYWLEEPILADDLEGYIEVCASVDVPIAAGESHYTRYEFKELIQRKAVDIVQADAAKVGGITEFMKVAALADAFGLPMAPHWHSQLHTPLVAAIPNGLIVECATDVIAGRPYQTQPWKYPIIPRDGYVKPLDRPGVGLEIDEAAISEYQVQRVEAGEFITDRGWRWPPFL